MLTREARRLVLFLVPVLFLFYISIRLYGTPSAALVLPGKEDEPAIAVPATKSDEDSGSGHFTFEEPLPDTPGDESSAFAENSFGSELKNEAGDTEDVVLVAPQAAVAEDLAGIPEAIPEGLSTTGNEANNDESGAGDGVSAVDTGSPDLSGLTSEAFGSAHQEIFSMSTQDNKFFAIDFGESRAMNPNIIPHPIIDNTWIIVAQLKQEEQMDTFAELVCEAVFQDSALRCLHKPTILPIAATPGGLCKDDLDYFNLNIGPHDARVFYGPDRPYALFGSNSGFTCFGQFVQDFRQLVDWPPDSTPPGYFRAGTELQRPPPWGLVEKNWFLFWDPDGAMYVHYDVAPTRIFARLEPDGAVGPDLAPAAAATDDKCLARYLPTLGADLESIHQATNSLEVTMCRRDEAGCAPDDGNTFLFTVFQHKTYFSYHSVYEPYVMVFRRRAPFAVHAVSSRPLWIHGREQHEERGTADMFYVTSMSWKERGHRYHGYLDDELFLAFGIEDERAGGIDLQAGHLLEGLGLCDEV